ncbi:hypothetical protein RPMA_12385 [Tardiphaga alba]|uniref:Uncharacterized protein n=1 Tax=Tardiphaga alba TaxID=340268 RepID=A0ABX8ACK3_9BRAD|nr:hypothetical protein [Tardiphaga alba]QUS39545.1 hypothetical protein RPMA_12385 [Tardiphaga alba]
MFDAFPVPADEPAKRPVLRFYQVRRLIRAVEAGDEQGNPLACAAHRLHRIGFSYALITVLLAEGTMAEDGWFEVNCSGVDIRVPTTPKLYLYGPH